MFQQIRLGNKNDISRRQSRCTSCVEGVTRKRLASAFDIIKSIRRAERRASDKQEEIQRLQILGRYNIIFNHEEAMTFELEGWRQSQKAPEEQYRTVVIINTSNVQLNIRFFTGAEEERYFVLEPHSDFWLLESPSSTMKCRGMDGREGTLNGWRVLPLGLVTAPYVVEAAAPPPLAGVPSLAELCAAQLVRTGTAAQARALPLPHAVREELALRIGVPRSETDVLFGL